VRRFTTKKTNQRVAANGRSVTKPVKKYFFIGYRCLLFLPAEGVEGAETSDHSLCRSV
jgi:hypothetical protein